MKIIHCSDLHIDSKMETNLSSVQARKRKDELLLSFEKMVEYAKNNEVRAIIIAGDMFDTSRVRSESKNRIKNIIETNNDIDFLYLPGNHDADNFIEQFDEVPKNLKLFSDNLISYEYDNVVISGLKLTTANSKNFYQILNFDENKINILTLHGQIANYSSKTDAEKISLTKLKNKNIDYLALGHIHNFVVDRLDKRGVYCYSGALEPRGFDECGDKGFVLIEIEGKELKYNFIPFSTRKFYHVQFDISTYDDWFDIERKVLENLKEIDKKNVVKIELVGNYKLELEKQTEILERKIRDEFYFGKVKDSSVLEINKENYKNDLSLKGEFIRSVLASDMDKELQNRIILMGLEALKEGEKL